jgi:hypothetical protein
MSNSLATRAMAGALAGAQSANPFAAAGRGAESSTFVKFVGQSGDFIYGQDDEELAHGTQLAADIENTRYSWAFWWDSQVLETIEIPVMEDPRAFEHEPDHLPESYDDDMSLEEIRAARKDKDSQFMDGWSVQGIVNLRRLDGEMEEFTLKLNAGVGMRSFQALLGAYGRLRALKAGKTPIIELGARKYKSKIKTVGTRYAPEFKIVAWKSEEELLDAAGAGDNPEDYDDEPQTNGAAQITDQSQADAGDETARPRGRRGARGANLG